MRTSDLTDKLDAALSAAQAELQNPTKDKTAKMKGTSRSGKDYEISYSYADIANVLTDVRPILAKHQIALTQSTAVAGGALILVTRLSHAGQWIEGDYPVCQIGGDHQEMGKAMTYARRYALTAMIGVAAEEDTDGQGASNTHKPDKAPAKISTDQAQIIRDLLTETKTAEKVILDYCRVASIDDIPANGFAVIKSKLEARKAPAQREAA